MPWELRAVPSDDSASLGTIEHVQAKLRAAVPEIVLSRDATGVEKLATMESPGLKVPDVIREHWLRSKGAYRGLFEGKDFTIEFHLGEDETAVAAVSIDVRGSGNPMPIIDRLARIEGWKLVDLRGDPATVESCKSFAAWRDDAVRQIEDGGG